jgi:hypothetical protein
MSQPLKEKAFFIACVQVRVAKERKDAAKAKRK